VHIKFYMFNLSQSWVHIRQEGKVVPVYAIKAYSRAELIALLALTSYDKHRAAH